MKVQEPKESFAAGSKVDKRFENGYEVPEVRLCSSISSDRSDRPWEELSIEMIFSSFGVFGVSI